MTPWKLNTNTKLPKVYGSLIPMLWMPTNLWFWGCNDAKVKWWSEKPLYFCKVSMLTKGNLLCFCRSVASLCTSPTDNKRTWQEALMSKHWLNKTQSQNIFTHFLHGKWVKLVASFTKVSDCKMVWNYPARRYFPAGGLTWNCKPFKPRQSVAPSCGRHQNLSGTWLSPGGSDHMWRGNVPKFKRLCCSTFLLVLTNSIFYALGDDSISAYVYLTYIYIHT